MNRSVASRWCGLRRHRLRRLSTASRRSHHTGRVGNRHRQTDRRIRQSPGGQPHRCRAHACGQVVDFATNSGHQAAVFVAALNHYLPDAIRILVASDVPAGFHSRHSATRRSYRYCILNRPVPSPLRRRTCHLEPTPLNLPAMRQAANSLLGIRDFRRIATAHPKDRSAARQVHRWEVGRHPASPDVITIDCTANGFLRHQIRRVNAVLTEIGKGRLPIHAMADALAGRAQHQRQIRTLPAKGMCLQSVHYPEYDHYLQVANYHETH